MSIGALFLIIPRWKQSKYPSTGKRANSYQVITQQQKGVNYWCTFQMDWYQNNFAEWNKPDKQEYIMHDSIYMKS